MRPTHRLRASLVALGLTLSLTTAPVAQPLQIAGERPAGMPPTCTPYQFGGHAYYFCHVDADLPGAQSFCHAFGTELASIQSRYENDVLAGTLQLLGRGRHWIGYSDNGHEGTFTSMDGSPTTFSAWAVGEPNNVGANEHCVELDGGGFWNDVPCSLAHANVLCEETSPCTAEVFHDHLYRFCSLATPAPAARLWCAQNAGGPVQINDDAERAFVSEHAASIPSAPLVCEDPEPCVRRFHDHHAYLFCTRAGTTGHLAAQRCRALGGALATLESAAEESFVYSVFALFRRTHFYIGLTDEGSEGTFRTLDGRPLPYARWYAGEPNNNLGDENCVELGDLGWNDVPCEGDTKNAFVCELP